MSTNEAAAIVGVALARRIIPNAESDETVEKLGAAIARIISNGLGSLSTIADAVHAMNREGVTVVSP